VEGCTAVRLMFFAKGHAKTISQTKLNRLNLGLESFKSSS